MRPPIAAWLLAASFLMSGLGATAATVYRCGSTYSQTPCPNAKIVDATDPRSAAQRAEARRLAADEHRLAAQMKHDRLSDEASHRPVGASSLSATPASPEIPKATTPRAVKTKRGSARSKPITADFVAVDPNPGKPPGRR